MYATTLVRPLLASDWVRFDYYAPRIKALGFLKNEYADRETRLWNDPSVFLRERQITEDIVYQLALYRRDRWLLPNLTHLRWNIYDYQYTFHLPLFLTPHLVSLAFAFRPDNTLPEEPFYPDDVVRILHVLADLCPNVTELEMYPQYPSCIVSASFDFAYDCQRLEGFHVDAALHAPHDPALISYLALQPRLRKVHLNMDHETAEELTVILSAPSHIHPFSSLQILSLRVPCIGTCTAFLLLLDNCRLFSIYFEVDHGPLAEEVNSLIDTLRRQCARYTLHAFELVHNVICPCESEPDPHPPSECTIGFSTLQPALYFPNMRVFSLNLPLRGWLSDEHLYAIADSWPGLIEFTFLRDWNTGMLSPATWKGVAYIVCRCVQLLMLDVTFDSTQSYITSLSELPEGLRPNHSFRFLHCIDSILPEDPYMFALSLFMIAPRVVSVDGIGWNPDPDAPLSHDPYAFSKQVDTILCKLRCEHIGEEYTLDVYGRHEIIGSLYYSREGLKLETAVLRPQLARGLSVKTLTRPLLKSDWKRFDYYASRIKALGYLKNEYADRETYLWNDPNYFLPERAVTYDIIYQLAFYRRGRWLLPNLTHLRWNTYDYQYTDQLPLFLGPHLTSFAFAFRPDNIPPEDPYNPEEVIRALNALVELCPGVTELEMYPTYPSNIVSASFDFAYDCYRLEGFHVNTELHAPLDPALISYLAAQPHLRKVCLSMDSETADGLASFLSPPSHVHPFSSLQILTLTVPYIRTCTTLLQILDNCRLFSICFEIRHRPLGDEVRCLFETLRQQCARFTLHVFQLVQNGFCTCESKPDPHPTPEYTISLPTFQSALHFSNMRFFMVDLPLYGWLSDEHLHEIADAWPGLVDFTFLQIEKTHMRSPATWQGIAYIVCRCSQLITLNVTFDTTQSYITSPLELPKGLRPNNVFRFLDYIDSVLPEDPYLFALSLFTIAPRIASLQGTGWDPDPDAPLTHDPYAFTKQVDTILCKLRCEHIGEEYILDVYGRHEIIGEHYFAIVLRQCGSSQSELTRAIIRLQF
ncbi:hypothetical protein ONZ51_g11943 [Trametes cubensis]|uniref:Uncharacterized protein n=1 Tax=Trametes cubensis TaxID=1111947 RepID=A0AAD7THJ0_9APHY|nr:hypothetical protein ONZ51_g11943 [Trametes cubensis]